jgi:hypothetical protein
VPVILLSLHECTSYGYKLMEQTARFGFVTMNPGTLYRSLRHMEKDGLCESEWETNKAGPGRRGGIPGVLGRGFGAVPAQHGRLLPSVYGGQATSTERPAERRRVADEASGVRESARCTARSNPRYLTRTTVSLLDESLTVPSPFCARRRDARAGVATP